MLIPELYVIWNHTSLCNLTHLGRRHSHAGLLVLLLRSSGCGEHLLPPVLSSPLLKKWRYKRVNHTLYRRPQDTILQDTCICCQSCDNHG